MVETIASAVVIGLSVKRVRVEVSITRGTPMIQIVGLAESAVREGRERIRAAAAQLGLHVPGLRITVNLAPADLRKGGAAFDLPIIVGILTAARELPGDVVARYAMVGELGLDGQLRSVRGALPIALHTARASDVTGLILPLGNLREARPAAKCEVLGARCLTDVLGFLRGTARLAGPDDLPEPDEGDPDERRRPDMADIRGQVRVKRALEVVAAGGHNVLLRGAPGAGKTTLAHSLPSILPPMTTAEAVEVTAVHSVAGRLADGGGLLSARPFRSPHHTISEVGLVGGGVPPRPGEVSLSHRGVLFLDELPEFSRRALDVLRQPLEEGAVHVVRARYAATFPSRFLLVAAMNPCPCGYLTEDTGRCICDRNAIRRYQRRPGGPLLDRIDMSLEVSSVPWRDLRDGGTSENSSAVRKRVLAARSMAARRLQDADPHARPATAECLEEWHSGRGPPACNADMNLRQIRRWCRRSTRAEHLLGKAVDRFGLSARAYYRVLKVARTIADLGSRDRITSDDVAEALQYRLPDMRSG
jgi:magnesium chelatase family protein